MDNTYLKITRSDGEVFSYENSSWGILKLEGFDAPEIEIFKADKGIGNGCIITGKRKKARELKIVTQLKNTNNLNSERKKAIKFHNLNYTYTINITYQGLTREVKDCYLEVFTYPSSNIHKTPLMTVELLSSFANLFADFTDNEQMFSIDAKWHSDRVYVDEAYTLGSGVVFDGVDDYCSVDSFNFDSINCHLNIKVKMSNIVDVQYLISLNLSGSTGDNFLLFYGGGAGKFGYFTSSGGNVYFGERIELGNLYNLSINIHNSLVEIFVDNVSVSSFQETNLSTVTKMWIGYGSWANCTIKHIMLYGNSLTDAEMLRNYNDDWVTDGLIMWLDGSDFTNDPETTLWLDRSGNGNNATPYNFAYTTSSGSDETSETVKATQNIYGVETRVKEKRIYYEGSEPAPIIVTITASGLIAENITIDINGNMLTVDSDLIAGDVLEINAETYDVFKNGLALSPSKYNSEMFPHMNVEFGDNIIKIESGDNLAFTSEINYTGRYDGI